MRFSRFGISGAIIVVFLPFVVFGQTSCTYITRHLSVGSRGTDVTQLQQYLIAQNLLAADSATGYFGKLTEAAVQQWQSSHGIVSSGTAASTGYGAVGPKTRAAIGSTCSSTSIDKTAIQSRINALVAQVKFLQDKIDRLTSGNTTSSTYISSASCTFNGTVIPNGQSVTAYRVLSVAAGSQCVSELRTCTNGTLSGSYIHAACFVGTSTSSITVTANVSDYSAGQSIPESSNNTATTSAKETTGASSQSLIETVSANKSSYTGGDMVTAIWQISSATSKDWVAIVPAGSEWQSDDAWEYTSGATSGSVTLNAPRTAGSYQLVLYQNNGSTELARSSVFTVSKSALDIAREKDWSWYEQVGTGQWEVAWEGAGSPAEKPLPYQLWWDNPHDDDFEDKPDVGGACRFHFDYPQVGMMTVDRILTTDGQYCPVTAQGYTAREYTGNITRRDEYLDGVNTTGATFEFDMQILDHRIQSQYDAVTFSFIGPNGAIAIYFSPNCVKMGTVQGPGTMEQRASCSDTATLKARPLDTTIMRKYRVVLHPGGLNFDLYTNDYLFNSATGSALPYNRLYGPGAAYDTGDAEYEFPTITLGDNTGNTLSEVNAFSDVSGAFILDGIRYTRGEFGPYSRVTLPSASSGPWRARTPPPLPDNVPITAHGLEFDQALPVESGGSQSHYYGRYFIGDAGSTYKIGTVDQNGVFTENSSPAAGTGVLHIDNSKGGSYNYDHLTGVYGNGSWTIEMRAKMLPGSTANAFSLDMLDRIGMVSLVVSTDHIQAQFGGKYKGVSDPVMMDTTDKFHIYRMIRPQNTPYVYVYVDDNPNPVIADFKMSSQQLNGSYAWTETNLWFGFTNQIFPDHWVLGADGEYSGAVHTNLNMLIDYIRWGT